MGFNKKELGKKLAGLLLAFLFVGLGVVSERNGGAGEQGQAEHDGHQLFHMCGISYRV